MDEDQHSSPGKDHSLTSSSRESVFPSWSEIFSEVCELRRQLSSLASMLPSSLAFRNIPSTGKTRIYFLGAPPSTAWESTLLATDIPALGEAESNRSLLHWHPVLEANFQSLTSGGRLSREEQLLWERKRLATWGLTSYELHAESGRIVFPVASRLYQCLDIAQNVGALCPSELDPNMNQTKMSPQICPSNPDLVAFVCNNDIWVTHSLTGSSMRLTNFHKGPPYNLIDDPLSAGSPSYVMQEEFNRYQGYWWQPKQTSPGCYRLLFELVDESEVEICCFPTTGAVEELRFPRAGTANAKSELKMLQFKLGTNLMPTEVKVLSLTRSLNCLFPYYEYLVRAGWIPDGTQVWCQLLDRRQQKLDVVLVSVDSFGLEEDEDHNHSPHCLPPVSVNLLYSESTEVWINVHDILHFLHSDDKGKMTFLWASEETGFRHLYLITVALTVQLINCVDEAVPLDGLQRAKVLKRTALTSGDWEVLPRSVWVDEEHDLVYFMGMRESPLEKHLYVVSLLRPGEIRLLTRPGYSYSIEMNKECTLVVGVYSNIRQLPACQVFRVVLSDWTVDGVNLSPVGYLLEPSFPDVDCHCPEILTHQLKSGETLYAMVFKPSGFEPDKQYPTVLNVYGGPEVQLVSNSFKGMRHLRMHMLAARGYCVLAIDSRGSLHRGIKFESHLHHRMGTVELADQVEVLRGLANVLGFIDMDRVAIHGWSYGGYMSLLGLALYPDVFKVSIAGAPVTSWSFYDTGYTERYMGLPESNVLGYRSGCVLHYINQFPDEEDRLLIIHGLLDENVHFQHTSMLINALVKAGKPYQLQVYPNERHSLRSVDASKHYETKLLAFLNKNL
ncbi:dipeptidyl peptidase 9-like [Neocloeon triangulifer]|uniref:dipeptidyl peptidase 9-like n=1 Tax=Neocloeon triangulifer TaxID=2078957 RepID=UPI00286EB8D7|nr:dipeptidyl peptidase 9-like [Neocloeon triangulifer]